MSGVRRGVKETETEIENSDEVVELDQPSDPLHNEEEQERSQDLESLVLIAELLEVAIHTILRIRQVYPVEFFERRVKFGIPVFQCVDPSIYEYVSEVVKSIGEEIAEGTLGRLAINIHQLDEKTPLEKFIFSFEYQNLNDGLGVRGDADILPLDLDVVQRYARGMLIKLNSIDAQLLPLESSGDLSFSIVMQLREETSFRVSEEDLNFDNTTQNGSSKVATGISAIQDAELVHIIRTGRLTVYLHVQESEAKSRGAASSVPK